MKSFFDSLILFELCRPRVLSLLLAGALWGVTAWAQALPEAGQAPRTYTVTELSFIPAALNNKGEVVGRMYEPVNQWHALLWQDGQVTDLGGLDSSLNFFYNSARSINDKGQIVGYSTSASGSEHAFLWENGHMTDLGTLGASDGSETFAYAINNQTQVVGSSTHAFLWQNGQATDIGPPGTLSSAAVAINNKGQVVGSSQNANPNINRAFLWQNGQITDLGTLEGSIDSLATGINNKGQVIGYADTVSQTHAFLWQNGQMTDLGLLADSSLSAANGINNKGQVVGIANKLNLHTYPFTHAFLWQNGQLTDLNTLLPAESGWVLAEATAINDKGQIIGTGTHAGNGAGFLLTPAPEPKSSSTLQISNPSWYLGTYPVGQTSDAGTIYLYANGPDPVRFADTTIEGVNSSDFFLTGNTCGNLLAAYTTCSLSFAYQPSAPGWRNATLVLNDNSAAGPYTIPLDGLGY